MSIRLLGERRKAMSKIIISLEFEEEPTAQEVIEYINELGEELYFEVEGNLKENSDERA